MNKILAFLTAWGAVMFSSASVRAQSDLDGFDFATKEASGWTLTARTSVNWNDMQYPTVADIQCRGENEYFEFHMNKSGDFNWLHVSFVYSTDNKGESEDSTATGDHLWLYIDGERWEYANISTGRTTFSNLEYPAPKSDIILPDWHGYSAVRRAEDQPWINLKLIYDRLANAKRIEWSFKSRDWTVIDKQNVQNQLPKNWKTARYVVDNRGLQSAVTWCARQVASKDAYVLPPSMFVGILRSENRR